MLPTDRGTPRPVMLVDDSLDDVFILTRLLRQAGVTHPIQVARDGNEAIRLLDKTGRSPDFPLPLAVFTDLNMPECDGFELLRWIQRTSKLKEILTVVISSSDDPHDIRRAHELGCHGYFRKHPTVAQCTLLHTAAMALAEGLPPPALPGLGWPGRVAALVRGKPERPQ